MRHDIELGYLGIEVPDPDSLTPFFGEVIGLVAGSPLPDGARTWRNDAKAHRLFVEEGPANDATYLGFEAANAEAFATYADRIRAAGFELINGTAEQKSARRVANLAHTAAPWGVRLELVHGLADADQPFSSPLATGGFLTDGVGFGHVVFPTTAFDESHAFLTDALEMRQSDWLDMEIAPGIELEVRFYHCNARHHTIALAKAPFDLPQKLNHVMFEMNDRDDVGCAFDRAWNAGLGIASGLGRHPNDGMFSFYVVSPSGFQVEVGYGGRLITDDWNDNRCYDRISAWGHQPVRQA
jgi:2,3-dihydroxybiphenyl 1,2-dioxygenase